MEFIFEIVAVVVVLVYAAAKLDLMAQREKPAGQGTATATPPHVPIAEQQPVETKRVLAIEGAESIKPKSLGFLKAFAVRAEMVSDIARYAKPGTLESFPAGLQRALSVLYHEGCLHGQEIVHILHRGEALKAGQALYFTMVNPPKHPAYVIGFVDKDIH